MTRSLRVLGAGLTGFVLLPTLGVPGSALALAAPPLVAGIALVRSRTTLAAIVVFVAVAAFRPAWDERLYATGVYLHLAEFATPGPRAIDRFAHGEWDLLSYEDGPTATIAVGRSRKSGNTWMSEETGFGPAVTMWLSLIRTPAGQKQLFAFTHGRGAWRVTLR